MWQKNFTSHLPQSQDKLSSCLWDYREVSSSYRDAVLMYCSVLLPKNKYPISTVSILTVLRKEVLGNVFNQVDTCHTIQRFFLHQEIGNVELKKTDADISWVTCFRSRKCFYGEDVCNNLSHDCIKWFIILLFNVLLIMLST